MNVIESTRLQRQIRCTNRDELGGGDVTRKISQSAHRIARAQILYSGRHGFDYAR
jgi:hypothetical protein